MRRDFTPYIEDLEFLEGRKEPWEAVKIGSQNWYFLHNYTPPEGYSPSLVSVAFRLPSTYPTTQIDMAYFHPHLQRVDGKNIPRATNHPMDGKNWQQWSRHRPNPPDWKDGIDYLGTHVVYFEAIMADEAREQVKS